MGVIEINKDDLQTIINSLPDNVDWLLRNDEEGFFAHVCTAGYVGGHTGISSIVYADTLTTALKCALSGYKAKIRMNEHRENNQSG